MADASANVSDAEIRKFDALAAQWWDPRGPMAPLHSMNPLRTRWIVERLARMAGRNAAEPGSLAGLLLLDVGCGAGLATEALARAGADVTGIDHAPEALAAARRHAVQSGLAIRYTEGGTERLAGPFDAVVALEVVEHVPDRDAFLRELARLVRPGGQLFLSTLNRTPRSWAVAKLGAEYLLRWLPRGTHDWRMFVTPAELGAGLRAAGLRVADISGMAPAAQGWRAVRDVGVNYIVMAEKPA